MKAKEMMTDHAKYAYGATKERLSKAIVSTQFRDDLSVDAIEDSIMRIVTNTSPVFEFHIRRLNCIFRT